MCGSSNNQTIVVGNHECCSQSTFVQDKLCAPFTLTTAAPLVIYALNTNPSKTFVSGTVSLDSGPTGSTLTVNFLLGTTIVETETLPIPGILAFTKTGFTSITLTGIGAAPFTPPYQGEFCITPRYALG